ncbi:MAG: exodeoxyribonuclease VII large subunit [Lachnospiraceae bacterium]|nr:exodeoxyribonuclease VII large subunit [Lachnospiraceae bacterium]
MKNAYSVGQINSYIKNMFAQDYMLRSVHVKGEVSNVKYHSSGHIYFTMKDDTGTLACIMFAGSRRGLAFTLREGMQIITSGRIDVYERDGRYQMYASSVVLDGEGQLYERYERLKKELEEMGMFSAEYKKPIPPYITTLGVVTAPTGAAIRDIINITGRRNPHVRIILYPAKVQGEGAAESIVRGIRALEEAGVDVMIVGRGGGSIEDLWAFNEEEVARAVFDCSIPVISAVGHETDTTITDFVADLRAPTPSAGAELAVFDMASFEDMLTRRQGELKDLLVEAVKRKRDRYERLMLSLMNLSPGHKLREQRMRFISAREHLEDAMKRAIVNRRHMLDIRVERLEALSPLKRLGSGYAFTEGRNGRPVKSVNDISNGDEITLYYRDGRAGARITEVVYDERGNGEADS